jgi:hypothetical protein
MASLLGRDLVVRVHRAQERAAGFERGLDLRFGESGAALGALVLDNGVDAFLFFEWCHSYFSLPIMWETGRPVAARALLGRSTLSHLDILSGRVDTISSS